MKVLVNVHLLVNEQCEYQNARCNDKNYSLLLCSYNTSLTIHEKLNMNEMCIITKLSPTCTYRDEIISFIADPICAPFVKH